MARIGRKPSTIRLVVELVEEMFVLGYIELKRGLLEIKGHIHAVEKGAGLLVAGAGLLFFATLTFLAAAVAALALVLPTWLAALIVTLGLGFFGVACLLTGLKDFKNFSLVPSETLQRVHDIAGRYKKVSAHLHELEEVRTDPELRRRDPGQGHTAG